ncbi:MAG TPA: hypothetical protein VG013_24925, partial [Gemmataceae bacterium]|nr:hypothetical protein [Gemmataceae bacterium]
MSTLDGLRHLRLVGRVRTERYASPNPGRGPTFSMPPRDREQHGAALLEQMQQSAADARANQERAPQIHPPSGVNLVFRSEPGFDLAVKSLEAAREGIELVNVREEQGSTLATVFIPYGRLTYFSRKFERYLRHETQQGRPQNQRLVESISEVRRAVLDSFWTEVGESLPAEGRAIWWEVWLRARANPEVAINTFRT